MNSLKFFVFLAGVGVVFSSLSQTPTDVDGSGAPINTVMTTNILHPLQNMRRSCALGGS